MTPSSDICGGCTSTGIGGYWIDGWTFAVRLAGIYLTPVFLAGTHPFAVHSVGTETCAAGHLVRTASSAVAARSY